MHNTWKEHEIDFFIYYAIIYIIYYGAHCEVTSIYSYYIYDLKHFVIETHQTTFLSQDDDKMMQC